MNNMNDESIDHLNLISWRMSQVRRKAGEDFVVFRKVYFKHHNKNPDAAFHGELCGFLSGMTKDRGVRLAIAAPRGSAKSTILANYLLYTICYGLEKFILVISNTAPQAEGFLSGVKAELATNPLLIRDFPEVCEIGKRPGPPRWRQQEVVTRNGIRILALGTGQQMRGVRHNQHRPSLILMDDLEADDAIQNPESYDKLHNWVTKTVLKSGIALTNVVCVGTIHHYDSMLARLTSPNYFQEWTKKIYQSVISWSQHPELWEKWAKIYHWQEEIDGAGGPEAARSYFEANKEAMLEGAQVLWPQSRGYYSLMVEREEDPVSFDSELQNDPVNPRDCLFNLNDVHYWDDRFGSEEELLASLGEDYYTYGACDPSLGRQNRGGDFSAIVTVVRDAKTGTIYVLDADICRRQPDKTIDAILAYNARRKYSKFAFEANNFQELMAKQLQERSTAEGSYLNMEQVKNTTDKKARIESLQPMIKSGAIQLSRRFIILLEQQMKYFPKGAHDDGLDALEMAIRLCKQGGGAGIAVIDWEIYPGYLAKFGRYVD